MSEVFVVRNQLGHYWGKKKRWVDGTKPTRVLTCKHRDECVNLLVELSSKDIDLRGEVIAAPVNERGLPQVEPSEHRLRDEDDVVVGATADAALAAGDAGSRDDNRT